MYIFLVILLGFVLRITFVIKPEGLWNDEYVSWLVASTPFNQGFFTEIFKQCHMPLYYLYLKPFAQFGDLILRFTSIIPSVLAIWIMYLAGKEYSEKCAKYSALITSILPFLVYYSQEVRLYSLVFLLSSLVLLFLIRCLKKPAKNNLILYTLFSLVLIFTHVLGVIFVAITTLYIVVKKKLLSPKILYISLAVLILVLPIGINILKQLPSSQWWGIFSYTNVMFLFSDFLSPILTNNINAPGVFYYNREFLFIFLITLPTLIGLFGIFSSLRKLKDILFIPLAVIIIMILLAICGKLLFITKYSMEILPVIILAISAGFDENKKLYSILFSIFVFLNLFSIFTIYYPSRQFRSEGHNLPAQVLNLQNPDKIIYTYYAPDRFERYLTIKPVSRHISKVNRFEYINNPSKILDSTEKNENISIVFLDSVSFIPAKNIEDAKSKNLPEMFITFSVIRHSLENEIIKNYRDITVNKAGSWIILNGTRK